MKNKRIFYVFVILISFKSGFAQLMIEQGPSGSTRDGSVVVYGLTGAASRLPFYRIKGSPFYNEQWRDATLYHSSGRSFGLYQARLNLATHEVHYKDSKGQELADDGSISKIAFADSTNSALEIFDNGYTEINVNHNGSRKYALQMNQGSISLLKVINRTVAQGDSLFGTLKRYYFLDKIDYYIQVKKTVNKLKRLSEAEIFLHVSDASIYRDWIRSNGLKLSKEKDVVQFLNFYNSRLN